MSARTKDRSLGKGLSALLPSLNMDELSNEELAAGPFLDCDIDTIRPNPYQPRTSIGDNDLAGLVGSIKEKGIIQPLLVRRLDDGSYELIAGERRLRAAKVAGLAKVPVLVKDVTETERLELALIENIQREDLNPLEEAESYQRLTTEFSMSQEDIAKKVGKERSTIANSLRMLRLPPFVKKDLWENILTAGHGRALLGLDLEEDIRLARDQIVEKKLNVRQAEDLIRRLKKKKTGKPGKAFRPMGFTESQCESFSHDLTSFLGTQSKVRQKGIGGKIEIPYKSPADFERLMQLITARKDDAAHQ